MSKNLKHLKNLGAQKIHEETHIALRYVQSVIYESFEGLTKIQFLGFISILEREYQLDLLMLKKKGLDYFEEDVADRKLFVVTEKKTSFTGLYIIIVIAIFSLAIYAKFNFPTTSTDVKALDNHTIVNAQKKIAKNTKIDNIDKNITDENLTVSIADTNASTLTEIADKPKVLESVAPKVEKKVDQKLSSIVILPRKRVWIGYINKTDHTKHQTVVKNSLTLDGSKVWLIALGHGNVNITLAHKTTRYSSAKSVRFLYKNGILKKLTIKEFKKLNNGRLW